MLYGREDRGTFGDMFGAANALFSGLAFAGIIYAVLLQRKELQLQRQELVATRKELEGQKLQLEIQNKTLTKQNFEDTFFQLLRLHNEILNAMDLQDGSEKYQGRDCITRLYDLFKNSYGDHNYRYPDRTHLEKIRGAYNDFFRKHQSDLGHYFRTLYNIVKFVSRSDVPDKRFYTNLVRAQLSNYELVLLFYNCLSDLGRDKFKPLVEEFALLKNMPKDLLRQPDHAPLFNESAYL